MSEPLTTAGNFEPDFEAAAIHIEKWALELLGSEKAVASARNIYADCQRQAAAAGYVMVRELDLAIELGVEGANNSMEYDDAIERLHAALANKNKS